MSRISGLFTIASHRFLERSSDDYSVKLLILKMLYLIFSTNGMSEYFYTNDLCVLMDVFLRELADLDEESESVSSSIL